MGFNSAFKGLNTSQFVCHVILALNTDHFPERHEATDRPNGGTVLCEVRNLLSDESQPSKDLKLLGCLVNSPVFGRLIR